MANVPMTEINKLAEQAGPRPGVSPAEKKTTKKAKGKAGATKATKPAGIGKFCMKLIEEHPDWTNQHVTDRANAKFPDGKTSKDCVAWYRSKMRRDKMEAEKAGKK